jgi:hypothetical protein
MCSTTNRRTIRTSSSALCVQEPVPDPSELGVLHALAPPLLHPPRVVRVPVSQDVALRRDDEHWRHRHGRERRHLRPGQVDRRVVLGPAVGEEQPCVAVDHVGGQGRVGRARSQLGTRARRAGHGRGDEDAPAEPDRRVEAGLAELHRHVVRDVPSGEDAGGIGEPGVRVRAEPGHGARAVLLRRGEAVLGREAAVEGGHDDGELGGEAEAPRVRARPAAGGCENKPCAAS